MTQSRVRACLFAFFGMCGCGLNVIGAAATETSVDGGSLDGGSILTDAAVDAAPPLARCANLPSTWGLVALVAGGTACPDGYTAGQLDLYAEPAPRADTCTCGCKIDTQPTCTRVSGGTYDTDNSDSCGLPSTYAWANDTSGACGTDMFPGPWTTNHDYKWAAPTRTGGSCKAAPEKHLDRIDFGKTQRTCVPNAGCEAAPPVTAPTRRCIVSDGDVSCPASSFTNRSVMAKSYDLTCTNACTCAVSGTCSNATMTLFAGPNCTGGSFTMKADGTCQSSTGTITVQSYRFMATLAAACTTAGTSAATGIAPLGTMTLCCE